MIDKSLVRMRFKKSLKTYNQNAIVQKYMAHRLINMLPCKSYDSVLEIGCATGVLTEQIIQNINYKNLHINDIVPESASYIDKLTSNYLFINGDIETVELKNNYDLIISNACIQWCEDKIKVIEKLYSKLNENGVLAISIFGNSNLKEIKEIFNIKDNYSNIEELKKIPYFNVDEEIIELEFNNPIDVLKHLKNTGANSIKEYKFTKTALKEFEKQYSCLYSKNGKTVLTYNPLYLISCIKSSV